jgi:hypothetical protein
LSDQGGTLTETTDNPSFYPDLRLPGHGYWNEVGTGAYQASSTAFITSNGILAETQRIDQAISVSGDNLVSNAKVRFFDPMGNLLKSGCAVALGQRFK